MQRQSLGSPNSKIHNTHGITHLALDPKESKVPITLEKIQSSNPSSSSHHHEKEKPSKPLSSSPSLSSNPDKFIHFIPIVTFLCFFILYLVSHDPSQSDLAHFNGFKHSFKSVGEENELNRLVTIKRSDVLAVRSLKNLREMKSGHSKSKYRLHRKLGEF